MQKLVGYTYEPTFKILSWYAKSISRFELAKCSLEQNKE